MSKRHSGKPNYKTLGSKLSSAELCRKNGWHVGTKIIGQENGNATIITITAIGEEKLLAKDQNYGERLWCLTYRDWWKVVAN